MLACLVLDLVVDDALFLILQIAGNHVVDAADDEFVFLVVLRSVDAVEFVDSLVDRPHSHHVPVGQIFVDRLGQAADEQIVLEVLQQQFMGAFVEAFLALERLTDVRYPFLADARCPKELFEIERVHLLHLDAADRHRRRLRQCHTQLRAAGDEAVFTLLVKELEHGQQVRVALYLVEEHQRVALVAQGLAVVVAQTHVEVARGLHGGEHLVAFFVLLEVDFNEMLEEAFADIAHQIGLANLPGTVDQENLVGFVG